MLRFLGKTTGSMAGSCGSSPGEGLSAWELVSASLSDDEDLYSYDSDDIISEGDGVVDAEPELNPDLEEGGVDGIISFQHLSVSPPMTFPVGMTANYVVRDCSEGCDEDDDYMPDIDYDDEDEHNLYEHDVDDELVPWKLKDRFGKQRIRKMGKKGGPKLNKAKGLPYYDNRPGFSYGKLRGR